MNFLRFVPKTYIASPALLRYREAIRDTIGEDSSHWFFRRIQDLYPMLENIGVEMPAVRPFYFDSERCRLYHVALLKDLDIQIGKYKTRGKLLDLDRWSEFVDFQEGHRDMLMEGKENAESLLSYLEMDMLSFIEDALRETYVTTETVLSHTPFLKISPGTLNKALIHLSKEGYIEANEDPEANPLVDPIHRSWIVHRVTEKGRRALRDGKS